MGHEVIQIDVASVLKQRAPRYYRWMPRFVVHWLERLICQDKLNSILRAIGEKTGVEAAKIALRELNIDVKIEGLEQIPDNGRYIFASNHPLGGLDGLALISLFGEHYNGNIRFLVNDLLMAVKPLQNVFLPVNKYGRQLRERVKDIDAAYDSDAQMITFPAGLCSRKESGHLVADLPWNKSIVTLAVNHKRDVVPVYFDGENSKWFYRWARWRKKLGIKFNLEMILLPREMVKSSGKTYSIHVASPVKWASFDTHRPVAQAAQLRDMVYAMRKRVSNNK